MTTVPLGEVATVCDHAGTEHYQLPERPMTTAPDPGKIIHYWTQTKLAETGWLPCCERWSLEVPYYDSFTMNPGLVNCREAEGTDG